MPLGFDYNCFNKRAASLAVGNSGERSSPGKNRARVAVGIGFGVNFMTVGPVLTVSFDQLSNKARCAALLAP